MICPRCQSGKQHLRKEHEGKEKGKLLWTVYHCQRCSFTWRDSEDAESIDHDKREAWFRVDPDNRDNYPHNIPPANEES